MPVKPAFFFTLHYFELKDKLDALSAAIEPLVTVVLGIFISLFVMSIFVPMFKMISLVGN